MVLKLSSKINRIIPVRILNTVAYSIFFPFLSYYGIHQLKLSGIYVSMLWVVYIVLSRFLSFLYIEVVSNKNWRFIIVTSRAVGSLGYVVLVFSHDSFVSLLLGVALIGVGSGFYDNTSNLLIASTNKGNKHLMIFMVINFFISIATIPGYLISLHYSMQNGLIISSLLYISSTLLMFLLTRGIDNLEIDSHNRRRYHLHQMLFASKQITHLNIIVVLVSFVDASFVITIPIKLGYAGFNITLIAELFIIKAAASTFVLVLSKYVRFHQREIYYIIALLPVIPAGFLFMDFGMMVIVTIVIIYSINIALLQPMLRSIYLKQDHHLKSMIPLFTTMWSIGGAISAMSLVFSYHHYYLLWGTILVLICGMSLVVLKNLIYAKYSI